MSSITHIFGLMKNTALGIRRAFTTLYSPHASSRECGFQAEEVAYHFLRMQGYRIVARNYRKPWGEIDLIGWDGDLLAFIEVKYRASPEHGRPEKAVGWAKQRQIFRVAREYRVRFHLRDVPCRFDIVSLAGSLSSPEIELIKGAFRYRRPQSFH